MKEITEDLAVDKQKIGWWKQNSNFFSLVALVVYNNPIKEVWQASCKTEIHEFCMNCSKQDKKGSKYISQFQKEKNNELSDEKTTMCVV